MVGSKLNLATINTQAQYIYIYIYIYIYWFFIITTSESTPIPCSPQTPTISDNTISVVQNSTATPGATKQLLPPDRVSRKIIYIYIYIYICQIN